MIPASQPATSRLPKRGANATHNPATISTTPTICIASAALPGIRSLNSGARYFVQSSVRTPANLSRPKRIGATVKAIRSSMKACTAGSLRTASRVGSGAVRVLIAPLASPSREFLPRQPADGSSAPHRRALADQVGAARVVLVALVREHADDLAVPGVPDRPRVAAVLDQARLVVAVAPPDVLDRVLADGLEERRRAFPLRGLAGDRAARDLALRERVGPVLDGEPPARGRVVSERDIARGEDVRVARAHLRVDDDAAALDREPGRLRQPRARVDAVGEQDQLGLDRSAPREHHRVLADLPHRAA